MPAGRRPSSPAAGAAGAAARSRRDGRRSLRRALEQAQVRLRVADGGRDLGSIADDPGIVHQAGDVRRVERRHDRRVEATKGLGKRRSLVEDRGPGEARLEGFQREALEERAVVANLDNPLVIVIADHGRIGGDRAAPPATGSIPDASAARMGPSSSGRQSSLGSSSAAGCADPSVGSTGVAAGPGVGLGATGFRRRLLTMLTSPMKMSTAGQRY